MSLQRGTENRLAPEGGNGLGGDHWYHVQAGSGFTT